ncbi:MAG TPA: hypothetical protein DCE41_15200 [Cytophagales bacterium]|nr:hypothetical protein [Cytophagales bacterium]HAA17946.1 hypothetical protein [Cytophagales bacterium]HAP62749.1 hypothetical protein [Cytophagales bacterium]
MLRPPVIPWVEMGNPFRFMINRTGFENHDVLLGEALAKKLKINYREGPLCIAGIRREWMPLYFLSNWFSYAIISSS